MPATLSKTQWLDAIDQHYLIDYLPSGGTAVKVAVCFDSVRTIAIGELLRQKSADRGFLVADVDGSACRLHMLDQVFCRIAVQLPWPAICDNVIRMLAQSNHWKVPLRFTSDSLVDQLALSNDLSHSAVSLALQAAVDRETLRDLRMAKDFRTAMYWLLRARLFEGLEGEVWRRQIVDWLAGKIRLISELKERQIYTKVSRPNARHFFGSLVYWIRKAGYSGLAVTIDGSRLVAAGRVSDGSVNYTLQSRIEAYQVIREFIDSTDEFDGLLLVLLAPADFLSLESNGKGLGSYQPLLFRVYDEIRDLSLVNPLTSLNRIAEDIGVPA